MGAGLRAIGPLTAAAVGSKRLQRVRAAGGQPFTHGFDLGARRTRHQVGQPVAADQADLCQRGMSFRLDVVVQAIGHGGEDGIGVVPAYCKDEGKREFLDVGGVE